MPKSTYHKKRVRILPCRPEASGQHKATSPTRENVSLSNNPPF
jgi:hypothetical protein